MTEKAPNLTAIEQAIEPALQQKGLALVYAELGQGVLRLYIDKPGGVTLADCETATREIDPILDAEDFFSGPYTLEVSSPGLNRPLRPAREADFVAQVGQRIKLELKAPLEDGQRRLVGRLLSCAEGKISLQAAEKKAAKGAKPGARPSAKKAAAPEESAAPALVIALADIKKANLIWDGEGPSEP